MAKKQNKLLSLQDWTSGEIPRLVVMIAYKGDDSVSVSAFSQKQLLIQKPGKADYSVASQNSYWRIKAQK